MSNEVLELSPLYQQWAHEWEERGHQAGVEDGLREAIETLMRKQYGEPAPDEMEALAAVSGAQLSELLLALTSDTHEAFRKRLGL